MPLLRDKQLKPLNVTALKRLLDRYEETGQALPDWAVIHRTNENLVGKLLDRGLNVQTVRSLLANEILLAREPLKCSGDTRYSAVKAEPDNREEQSDFLELARTKKRGELSAV